MIDLHTHVLPGLDDGAVDIDDALALLREMESDGVRVVCATPHVRDDFPTTPASMRAALATMRDAVSAAGIRVELRGGAEIALDRLPALEEAERRELGLGGNPALLLLETPYGGWPLDLTRTCAELFRAGIQPVIAHPERNREVIARPTLLVDVVRSGGVVQVTAASVDGRLGSRVAACVRTLLEIDLVHVIASDAHGAGVREAGLTAAVRAVGDPGLGRWLVEEAPAALLAGEPLESRPAPAPRRRLPFRRRTRR